MHSKAVLESFPKVPFKLLLPTIDYNHGSGSLGKDTISR